MRGMVRPPVRRSGRRRGFTLLEVGVAAAMFMTVMGVVAVASARAQFAAQSARSLSELAGEVEFLLDRLGPGDVGVYGLTEVPSPCPEDAFRSCLTVFGRPAYVSWSVVPGGSWTGEGGDDSGPSLTVVATAVGDRDVRVVRSREVRLPSSRQLVRLVAAGPAGYEGPVFLHAASGGPLLRDDGGVLRSVGAVVGPSGAVVLEVPEGRCRTSGECLVALSPDGGSVAGLVALSHGSVTESVLVADVGVAEHVFEVAPSRPVSVLLEALLPSGERSYPTVPGSVCLHIAAEGRAGWEDAGVACNTDDPRMVTFSELAAGGRPASLPDGMRVRVSAAPVSGVPCTAGSGRMVPTAAGWSEAPAGTDLPCSQDLWGAPSGFRASPEAPLSEGALVFVPDGRLPALVWAADPPDFVPMSASGGMVSEYTQGGTTFRVHTFANAGSAQFVVSDTGTDGQVDFLVVGGGGAGGKATGAARSGGGGGGGGFVEGSTSVTVGSYAVVVGAGGDGSLGNGGFGGEVGTARSGFSSSAFSQTAVGGGGGGNGGAGNGAPGGSGGGGGRGSAGAAGAGTSGQGAAGGQGTGGTTASSGGAGGGGAGSPGENGSSIAGGSGGGGRASSISGGSIIYAGGGGGARLAGNGGSGGSGGGGGASASGDGSAGSAGLGGGGGGAATDGNGGNGGSGVVIVRYRVAQVTGDESVVPAAGTVGGVRVDAPWSAPFDCSFPCTAPAPSVVPPVPFLDVPAMGVFGVPGRSADPGDVFELTVRPASRSGAVPLTLAEVSGGVSFEYRDDTLRDAYDQDPEPAGPPPPVWFALAPGGSVPSTAFTPGGQVRLRVAVPAGSADHAARWALDGTAVSARTSFPAGGGTVVDLLAPAVAVAQGGSMSFRAAAVASDGGLFPLEPGVLAGGRDDGAVAVLDDVEGEVAVDVYAPPAGLLLLETGLPSVGSAPLLPVLVLAYPAAPEVTSPPPAQMLQGTADQVSVTLRDLSGALLPGWPVWVWAEAQDRTFLRDVRAREVACITSAQGTCLLEMVAGRTVGPAVLRTFVASGWALTVAPSSARSLTVVSNPSGIFIDGSIVSPGGEVSSRALVLTAAQSPVPGTVLQVSSQVSFSTGGSPPSPLPAGSFAQVSALPSCPSDVVLCVAVSGPSDGDGAVFLDLAVAPSAQAGVYAIPLGTASGLSSSWRVTVAPLTASAELSETWFVAPGGSVVVPVTLREPSGAPARPGRVVSASSPVPGVRAEVLGVSGRDGAVELTLTLDASVTVPPSGSVEVLLSVDGRPLDVALPVGVRQAVSTVVVEGAAVRGAESSQLRLRLRDAGGEPLGPRPATVVFPSWLSAQAPPSACVEGLFCFDAAGELLLTVTVPPSAPPSGTLRVTVDGVPLTATFTVVD